MDPVLPNSKLPVQNFSTLVSQNKTQWFPKTENYSTKKECDVYDAVIRIDSLLKNVQTGIPIEIKNTALKRWNEIKVNPIISVLGLYNKGKTYILSRIFDLKLESSFFSHTEGLSFITSRSSLSNVLIGLDTKGSNKPVKSNGENNEQDIKDSQYTEIFLREMALYLSDMVLIVVDRLTRDDQLYIQQVQQKYSRIPGKDINNIIIVHNLSHCRDIEQMNSVINEEIVDSFLAKVLKTPDRSPYYVGYDGIRHVVLCADENGLNGSPTSNAGKQVNKKSIELLREWLTALSSISQNSKYQNLCPLIKDSFNNIICNYFNDNKVTVEIESVNNSPSFILKDKEVKLSYLTNLKLDMAGIINGSNTQPCIVGMDSENFYLEIDCTGFEKKDLVLSIEPINNTKKLKIKSKDCRNFDLASQKVTIIHDDFKYCRQMLEWEYIFTEMVEDRFSSFDFKNGVLKLVFKKKKSIQEFKLEELTLN